jgi:hypothetical protein
MTSNQIDSVMPPLPCTPIFYRHEGDIYVLSNETLIPDLSIFIGLKGCAKQIPHDKSWKKYKLFQEAWKNSEEYKRFPYDFENVLKVTLSHNPADWLINQNILDKSIGCYARVSIIGQLPKQQ